jgi:hypothetical protein
MNILKNIQLEGNRIIVLILIPGLFAISPFFVLLIQNYPEVKGYLVRSDIMTTLTLFILSIPTGLILEDIGSRIENILYKLSKKEPTVLNDEWDRYLKLVLPSNSNLVAQRYLKTILFRMKFELSFATALIIMTVGLIFLNNRLNCCEYIIPLMLSGYLFYESNCSVGLMVKTRKLILEKLEQNI